MKRFIFIFSILFACTSAAQPPRTDYMSVNEFKSELHIFGDFGTAKGAVWVDSVALQIVSWSDSVIVGSLPVSGKGSAGLVEVAGRSYRGKGRMLTSLKPYVYSEKDQLQPYFPTQFIHESKSYWHFRVDLESRLINKTILVNLATASDSRGYTFDQTDNGVPKIDSTIIVDDNFQLDLLRNILLTHSTYTVSVLDSEYKPTYKSNRNQQAHSHHDISEQGDWGSTFLPRNEYIVLKFIPSPTPRDTNYFGKENAMLSWTSPSLPVNYQVQISADSTFNSISVDSILSVNKLITFISTPGFWRVRVINEAATGSWSAVAHFSYAETNSVEVDLSNTQQRSIVISPNPCNRNISFYFIDGFNKIVIYDQLGRAVSSKTLIGEKSASIDISNLPAGVYYAHIISMDKVVTRKIQIKK